MLRIVGEVKPSFVVCENVPGIIKLALDTVLSDLEDEGYTTETFIIPACAKNAWHRRDRIWVIAYTNSIRCHHAEEKNGQSVYDEIRNSEIEEQSWRQQQCRISESSSVSTDTDKLNGHISGFCPSKVPQFKSSGILKDITINTNSQRLEEYRQSGTVSEELPTPRCDSWWETEPGVGRVADGVSNRVDRIKGLGNAIVPQVAYEIFKSINTVYDDI